MTMPENELKPTESIMEEVEQKEKNSSGMKYQFLTGAALKWIAIITMFIDHFGAVVLNGMLNGSVNRFSLHYEQIHLLYKICRSIGRIAFPIFCFLLIEGFLHTRNLRNYIIRLTIFAFISEIPFNLAINGTIFDLNHQNVFFTLVIGAIVVSMMAFAEKKQCVNRTRTLLFQIVIAIIGMLIASLLKTDYSYYGIFSITILYLFRKKRENQCIAGALSFIWEIPAPIAYVPIFFYNGKRGKQLKYFFYLFYPIHLLVLVYFTYLFQEQGIYRS